MSANQNWRDYVTDDVVEQCRCAGTSPVAHDRRPHFLDRDIDPSQHPLSGLANPARAIQLGLVDALGYLVEDKLINVNAKQWKTYEWRKEPVHLLTVAANANRPEEFDYLLSLDAIDFNGDSTECDGNHRKYIVSSALVRYICGR